MSSGDSFAYSTTTSKYRSPSNTPVSSNSYSMSCLVRRPLVSIRSPYGNARCGYLYWHFM